MSSANVQPDSLDDPRIFTVEYLITRKFQTPEEFSIFIESDARRRNLGYLEALLDYCDNQNIEPIAISNLISPSLKDKIQAEAEDLNLLKRKKGKLPI